MDRPIVPLRTLILRIGLRFILIVLSLLFITLLLPPLLNLFFPFVLALLVAHPKRVFTKQDIYDCAWNEIYIGEDKTINVHISNIRKKIKEFTDTEFIETVWGIGYKLAK